MASIGLDPQGDDLVLTARRDFSWKFTNVDSAKDPVAFPDGALGFEVHQGGEQNAIYKVTQDAAEGGTYSLSVRGVESNQIDFDDVSRAAQEQMNGIYAGVSGISLVGAENVFVSPVKVIPEWGFSITLNTGVNEVQHITYSPSTNGGDFKMAYGLEATDPVLWDSSAGTIEAALESLSGIGSGNVSVTELSNGWAVEFIGALAQTNVNRILAFSYGIGYGLEGTYFPLVRTATEIPGTSKLNDTLVNTINKTINDIFNSFEDFLGVDLNFVVTSDTNIEVTARGKFSFGEAEVLTLVVGINSDMVEGAINAVLDWTGLFSNIDVDFHYDREFTLEFIGDLAQTPMGEITVDDALLTGSGSPSMAIEQLQEGRSEFAHWPALINGSEATVFVPSVECDSIPVRSNYQLVWRPLVAESGVNLLGGGDGEDDQVYVVTSACGGGSGFSTEESRSGTQSYKMVTINGGGSFVYLPIDSNITRYSSSSRLGVDPGDTYKVSCWVYQDSANASVNGALYWRVLLIDVEDEQPLQVLADESVLTTDIPTDEWIYFSHVVTIPPRDVYGDRYEDMQTYIQSGSTVDDGTVFYIDDWSLERVELAKGGSPVTHGRVSRRGTRR